MARSRRWRSSVGQEISSAAWARGSGASGLSAAGLAAKTVSHGLIGGAVAHAQGGKFGHGFLSSGVTAASSPYIANGFDGNRFAQGALASMVGGTVSSATGGKFANGAVTAAMAYAFNQLSRNATATQAQKDALSGLDANEVYGADRARETKFFMDDDGRILGTTQEGCIGNDICNISLSELPAGTSLIGHTHAPADLPHSQRLTGMRARVADMMRDVPGHGDAAPLSLGGGYPSAIVTPRGYRYVIEGSPGSPRLQYLGGGDSSFGMHVQTHWQPNMSRSQQDALVRNWMKR